MKLRALPPIAAAGWISVLGRRKRNGS